MNRNLHLFWLFACALSFAPDPAHAVDYCVGSIAQFADAMNDAEIDGTDSLIQFRSGTYTMSNNVVYQTDVEFIIPAGKLTVRGGYNADCSEYSLTPGATTINGGGNRLVARTQSGDVTFVGLRLNSTFLVLDGNRTGDADECPGLRTFALRRLRIDQGSADVYSLCQSVVVENALFTNGVVVPGQGNFGGDTSLGVNLISDAAIPLANLTMTNSTISNGRLHLRSCCDDGVPRARLYNSIFDRPAGNDIFNSSVYIIARHNRYDGISSSNGGSVGDQSNNVSSAPQLDAQYVPTIDSPMRNTGTESVPDGLPANDLAGGDRVIGAGVDRGALESPVDGTGIYVVTNTNASGNGSLAQAVQLANDDAGFNTIRFAIASGSCPHTINLAGTLQIRESVLIDGWSQPGSILNSEEFIWNARPCVVLNGAGAVVVGIESMSQIGEGRIDVRGLAFEGFALAIALAFGEDHLIYGNQFGGRIGSNGPLLGGNEQGIAMIGGGRTTIGGTSPSSRNLIGDSSDVGVLITTFLGLGGDDNNVINNLIGVDKTGGGPLPNGTGIRISGGFNRVRGNLIGRNTDDGIRITGASAEGNVIEDNYIGGGLGLFGGNGRAGVLLQGDAHDNVIGPNNLISRNGDSGVRLLDTSGGRNTITANTMSLNDSPGIDLGANGVTPNDFDPQFCSPDFGCTANREQNFPTITEAYRVRSGAYPVGRPMRIEGLLTSVIGGPYRVELFASNSCYSAGHGQGSRYLGFVNVSIANAGLCAIGTGNCSKAFGTYMPELDLDIGDVVTATATSPGGDTSEFSACMEVIDEPIDDTIFADGFEN